MNKNKENSYPKPQFKPIVMLEPYDIYVAIRQQIAKWIRDQPTTLSLQETVIIELMSLPCLHHPNKRVTVI